ncbi:hypothetical protein HK100_000209 [Physocladia obscura]|uniref:Cystathionine gamma-synthase n=1 Tax=Physocladia obscura TaxID=109957 RepID=A0AAD5T4Q6_9FUNG|nr:hypothetical protein HK100_000209 [Physocladia obscura]
MSEDENLSFSTRAIHSDDNNAKNVFSDISPPLHVSSTYKYPVSYNYDIGVRKGVFSDPDELRKHIIGLNINSEVDTADPHVYSRYSTDTRDRLETVLGSLEGGHATTYSSGLAAIAAAFAFYQPTRLILPHAGYFGTHGVASIFRRSRPHVQILVLEDFLETYTDFGAGDLVWLEMPQNPNGEIYDISAFRERCKNGAVLVVDATFSPPPLMYTLELGAHCVMHSSTKFLGGHSDLLGGVLAVKDLETAQKLRQDRSFLGSVMGNMEAWLLLRSLRSLEVRVTRQSESATTIAAWLASPPQTPEDVKPLSIVAKVYHATLQQPELLARLNSRGSGVLSVEFISTEHAFLVCNRLRLFQNATSLGGVESLIDWRRAFDDKVSGGVCRISIGLENVEDLKADLRRAFLEVKDALKSESEKKINVQSI